MLLRDYKTECELVRSYYKWLEDNTHAHCDAEKTYTEITTPYLDRHNDYIQLYLKHDPNGYTLTDDSNTLDDLEQSGFPMDSRKCQKLLNTTISSGGCYYMVKIAKNELFIKTTEKGFPEAMHSLIQAILALNGLLLREEL